MKDEMNGVAIEYSVGLKPKKCPIPVSISSEYKKTKVVNKNVVATISHDKYKHFLLDRRCLTYSVNKLQS